SRTRPRPRSRSQRRDQQPVADRQHRGLELGIVREAPTDLSELGRAITVAGRSGTGRPAAPEDVVGDDERAGGEARSEGIEVARVLRLQGVDEGKVERALERRPGGREGVQRRGIDDRDPRVRNARLAPERPGPIGPVPVGIDGHDRSGLALPECGPQRRVADRGADLDRPPSPDGEDGEHAPTVPVEDRDALRRGRGLHLQEHRVWRARGGLDPVEVLVPGRPASLHSRHAHALRRCDPVDQTRRPAPKYSPAARIVPAAMVPTLMYSRPVADSIDRVRAVWTAAQLTINGKTRPTSRRSQTNNAQGPASAANAGVPPGPAPTAIHATKSASCAASAMASQRDSRTRGASGSRGVTRYQWPSTIAAQTPPRTAARRTSSMRSGMLAKPPPPQPTAANSRASAPATTPAAARIGVRWPPCRRSPYRTASTASAASAARRGASQAGSRAIARFDCRVDRPVSASTARNAKTAA